MGEGIVMISSLLIANRGEIACRVIRTARSLGIRTIAVYSDADGQAPHVMAADEAYHIGPPPAADSYLRSEKILAVAKESGAEAIHPGYGFLSENADFAEACTAAGIIFVGPPPDAIRAMGLKDAAKSLMEKSGVPVVPGYHGENQDPDLLAEEADKIGYPVLIKAVAGGGGKGMRRVDTAQDFAGALQGAQREGQSSFGDPRVLIEKYIGKPRHIEVQVFADSHGHVVHLFERDCSLQRRHQKVVEEAPAPGMTEAMREAMGEAAVKAAGAVGYQGAGTVEFIVDASDGLKENAFYFMEMNTRLQVEHPVTEMITRLDLVEWQLRVASGETLPLTQRDLSIQGHAVEARLYAEDPQKKFMPSTGTLLRLRFPQAEDHIRVDSGVAEGGEVTMYYDPMIAKLIAWGETREDALRRLRSALRHVQIAGPKHNVPFLEKLISHERFVQGDVDTHLIDDQLETLMVRDERHEHVAIALACLAILLRRRDVAKTTALASNDPHSPWHDLNGWRVGGAGRDALDLRHGKHAHEVMAYYRDGSYHLTMDDLACDIEGRVDSDGNLHAKLNDQDLSAGVVFADDHTCLSFLGATYAVSLHDPLQARADDTSGGNTIVAPMPGAVTSVSVSLGDEVNQGDAIITIEAMKMEHVLKAPMDGPIATLPHAVGDQVEDGTVLATLSAEAETS